MSVNVHMTDTDIADPLQLAITTDDFYAAAEGHYMHIEWPKECRQREEWEEYERRMMDEEWQREMREAHGW